MEKSSSKSNRTFLIVFSILGVLLLVVFGADAVLFIQNKSSGNQSVQSAPIKVKGSKKKTEVKTVALSPHVEKVPTVRATIVQKTKSPTTQKTNVAKESNTSQNDSTSIVSETNYIESLLPSEAAKVFDSIPTNEQIAILTQMNNEGSIYVPVFSDMSSEEIQRLLSTIGQ